MSNGIGIHHPQTAAALAAEPSPAAVARAVECFGKHLAAPWAPLFAYRVSQGDSFTQAYLQTHEGASRRTAETQGRLIGAHPRMRELIAAHRAGALALVRASTVLAVEQLVWLCQHSDSHRLRLDAANSILDRGGVPKTTTVAIEASLSVGEALSAILDPTVEALPLPLHESND